MSRNHDASIKNIETHIGQLSRKIATSIALCDLRSSVNVMPLKKDKEFKVGEITPSNITLTPVDSSVTQQLGILRDV